MKRKLRLLERARTARRAVRDRTAAQAAAANDDFRRAYERWRRATDDLASAVARAHGRLGAVQNAADLWKLDADVAALRKCEQIAQGDVERARKSMENAQLMLATSERDLKVTDRLLARCKTELRRHDAMLEQRATDDLAALRRSA